MQSATTAHTPENSATTLTATPSVVSDVTSLMKPRLSSLVLVTTAGGLWLAPGKLGLLNATLSIFATAGVVGAANALNCYLERDSDRFMRRTQGRPLPAGRMASRFALVFGVLLALVSHTVLLLASNWVAAGLAALAFGSYVWIYTPMKPRTAMAVLVGTIPGAIPPVIGWAAASPELGAPALVLFGILVLWQIPHFLAISIKLEGEYAKAGLRTFSGSYGLQATRWGILIAAIALLAVCVLAVPLGLASWIYLATAAGFGGYGVWKAIVGFRVRDTKDVGPWATSLFKYSLIHLSVLFLAMVVDGLVMSR